MDVGQIGAAAFTVAVGGMIGVVFAHLYVWLTERLHELVPSRIGAHVLAGIVVGTMLFGAFQASARLGPEASLAAEERRIDGIMERARRHPVVGPILAEQPELAAELDARLRVAYDQGGESAMSEVFIVTLAAQMSARQDFAILHGRDEDLRAWVSALAEVLALMADQDPFMCLDIARNPVGFAQSIDHLPPDVRRLMQRRSATVTALARNADPARVHPMTEADRAAVIEILRDAMAGDAMSRFLDGEQPTSEREARAVCDAFATLLTDMIEHPRGMQVARYLFTG